MLTCTRGKRDRERSRTREPHTPPRGAPGWELAGEHTAIEPVDGRPTLHIRTGSAHYRPASLADGTIEFDMAVTPAGIGLPNERSRE